MAERKTLTAGPVTTLDQGKEIQRRRKKRKDEMRLKANHTKPIIPTAFGHSKQRQ